MKNYDVVKYWNERNNPCSTKIDELTDTHKEYLKNQVYGCERILDFGPGYGRMFSSYKGVKEVIGVDVTDQHKQKLEDEAKKQGFKFKLILNSSNICKLDFPNKYFDAVVTSEVLFHQTPDKVETIMKELIRISKRVITITLMNLNKPFDELGKYKPDNRYCFNYDYHKICENNNWILFNKERVKNQVMFVYRDTFKFKYQDYIINFAFDDDDYYMSKIIKTKKTFYEEKYLNHLKNKGIINKESSVVDIGSYLGNHAIYFSKFIGCKLIYCFEPTPYSYRILLDNLEINNVDNYMCFPHAISDKNGKLSVYKSNPNNPGANHYTYNDDGIVCVPLDIYKFVDLDFLKIDVENMEMKVLKGSEKSIEKFRPIIMVEVGKSNKEEMLKWIDENKYKRIENKVFNGNTWLLRG